MLIEQSNLYVIFYDKKLWENEWCYAIMYLIKSTEIINYLYDMV